MNRCDRHALEKRASRNLTDAKHFAISEAPSRMRRCLGFDALISPTSGDLCFLSESVGKKSLADNRKAAVPKTEILHWVRDPSFCWKTFLQFTMHDSR